MLPIQDGLNVFVWVRLPRILQQLDEKSKAVKRQCNSELSRSHDPNDLFARFCRVSLSGMLE